MTDKWFSVSWELVPGGQLHATILREKSDGFIEGLEKLLSECGMGWDDRFDFFSTPRRYEPEVQALLNAAIRYVKSEEWNTGGLKWRALEALIETTSKYMEIQKEQ